MGLFDLDKHFAFYAAYHSNPINIAIHMLFVWPIFFTAVLLFNFIPAPFDLPHIDFSLFGSELILVFNFGFLFTLIYAVFYVCFDFKAGSLAGFLCFFCWVASSALASLLGFQLAWKVVLVVQLISWTGQFIGHGVFEVSWFHFITYKILPPSHECCNSCFFRKDSKLKRRAPALLDNILQAFLMAPFFVLFEALQILFGYEPYPGFHVRVTAMVAAETEDWRNKKGKLLS